MKEYKDGHYTGERALFRIRDAKIENCLFDDGESPLKEARNLTLDNVTFGYKYPLWYGKNHEVRNSKFLLMSRSGIWYTDDSKFIYCDIIAPKEFRRCKNIYLEDVTFHDASETLWTCQNVTLKDVTAKGDYLLKDSFDVHVDNLKLDGNYAFDGGKNLHVVNSVLNTKDAFWNCENVYLENCAIKGEYFGWNSKNIYMKNCTISSHQGFCYMKNIRMENCRIENSDLIFEYCEDIDCEIDSDLGSVKNPVSGILRCKSVREMIRDDERIDLKRIHVYVKDGESYHEI